MPAKPPSSHRSKNRQLHHAAADKMLLVMRCDSCRRMVYYWAEDLIPVLGEDYQIHIPPFSCGKCGTDEFMSIRWKLPAKEELRNLTVRRPVKKVTRWIWRDGPA